ncbi:MAG: UvrD-helicase domain-containing protein, partial [Candidatus Peregrinibacteria bacterium]|nr:UvrD-helicase domain-containing protein [Candidatus Peregrinibacteria bacterium]
MKDLLSTLNSEQHTAVTHVDGPLLIIAGAGTGKTRVLTHRISNLIESGAAAPEEILALTFTEKATLEMQERLDILLPYGYQELWVKTFHSFCDATLRESGLELGLDTAYQIFSQTDLSLFLKDNLYTFDLNHYRPLGNPLRFVRALLDHFSHLRDEVISPARYLEHAEKVLASAEDEIERENGEKMLELARAYVRYDELLFEKSVLDFASLNYLTLRLFEENLSVLQNYQQRFKYILVDEFQDTNTAQNRLVELLARNHKNLMVVGDDDQCIYKWRGASLTNILDFEKRFPNAKKVVLTQNYRSTQPILDTSYAVIQNNNPLRLEAQENIDKRLQSHSSDENPKKPHIIHFEHYSEEVQFLTEHIQRRVKEGKGMNYRDCAVLVRATAHAIPFIEEFNRQGIPYHFSGTQGLYQREEIKDLMALLRVLSNSEDDLALFRLLSIPTFNFDVVYLLTLVQKAKSSSSPLFKVLEGEQKSPDLFSGVGAGTGLATFFDLFHKLREMANRQPTSRILGTFLNESGYLAELED